MLAGLTPCAACVETTLDALAVVGRGVMATGSATRATDLFLVLWVEWHDRADA